MQMQEYPLVTNAIPLYRSRRFTDTIIANIEAITYPNVEIIISDRHLLDDAIDILEQRFHDDPRCIFLRAQDELNFVQHYNFLLASAKGRYFRWMPHDDSYPVCALGEKVRVMENDSQCVLVNGPWQLTDLEGKQVSFHKPVKSKLGRWSFETSMFIAFGNYEAHAFKGLFRADVARGSDIFLFDTKRIISAERCWVFGMSLKGHFHCLDSFQYIKRIYDGSAGDVWKKKWKPVDLMYSVYYKYLYLVSGKATLPRRIVFLLFAGPMLTRRLIIQKGPPPIRRFAKRFPGKMLKRQIRNLFSRL